MEKIPLIIDTDPGVDDTIALIMCMAWEGFDIQGITTVGGNVGLEHTSNNARNIVKLCGKEVKVAKGAEKPLYKTLTTASHIHGAKGMGRLELPASHKEFLEEEAVDVIYQTALAMDGKLRILTLGPLTNLAMAIEKYPELPQLIHSAVVMGGAMGVGNVTPAAEFNIFADPEAAKIVFDSGMDLTMVGLDVTIPTVVTPVDNERIKGLNNPVADVVAELVEYAISKEFPYNDKGAIMHDPLSAAVLMEPTIIETIHCHVDVDCRKGPTSGMTLVDRYGTKGKAPNVHVAVSADNQRFVDVLMQCLEHYS